MPLFKKILFPCFRVWWPPAVVPIAWAFVYAPLMKTPLSDLPALFQLVVVLAGIKRRKSAKAERESQVRCGLWLAG